MGKPIYKIKNLSVTSSSIKILTIKSFEVHRGACYIINGRVGSGKSTFIDILARQYSKYDGQVIFEDDDLATISKSEYNSNISYVEQTSKASWGTVNSYLNKQIGKYPHLRDHQKLIDKRFKSLKIENMLSKKMRKLTPGELRLVHLLRGIISDTKVLLIDDFDMHLGSYEIDKLSKILYRKCNYDGVTIIMSSNNKELIKMLANITINMDFGRIKSVRSKPKKRFSKKK